MYLLFIMGGGTSPGWGRVPPHPPPYLTTLSFLEYHQEEALYTHKDMSSDHPLNTRQAEGGHIRLGEHLDNM